MTIDIGLTSDVARVVSKSHDLASLTRPLLDILHRLTGLDTTYLTEVNRDKNEQTIIVSEQFGSVNVPEGLVVDWSDTLCRRALEAGTRITDDVPNVFPGSETARTLGLQTYVSVPVTDDHDLVMGTLCGASGQKNAPSTEVLGVMELFARLISDQWTRDQALAAADQRATNAEQRLTERAMFLAESEHKLKTPLTIIRGWSSMLDDDEGDMTAKVRTEAVRHIRTASEVLAQQIEDMISEARSEVLTTNLHITDVDVDALLRRVEVEFSANCRNHELVIGSEAPCRLRTDEFAVWQIFGHLVENAIKYTPARSTVKLVARSADRTIQFQVSDDGPGLPEDVDVFAPFVRGDKDTLGSGLGLHIVRNLVKGLGGEMKVDSTPGQGTCFTMWLPNL